MMEWIEWKGGDCPLDDIQIEAEMRDGSRYEGSAWSFMRGRWQHSSYMPHPQHIIAYRIVEPGK
jgi:hypothetical protein